MERKLETEVIEGEIAIVIKYNAGESSAIDVLQGAMNIINALDGLDKVLLKGVDSNLEPVSILNDVQHSSLKLLLARALKKIPDEHINNLDWKKFVGSLLVNGKHRLISKLEANEQEISTILDNIGKDYVNIPGSGLNYDKPDVKEINKAIKQFKNACSGMENQEITIQSELGDIVLKDVEPVNIEAGKDVDTQIITNIGQEIFKIKAIDMIGKSKWKLLRNKETINVAINDSEWLNEFLNRKYALLPGDSIKCEYKEEIYYDKSHNETNRQLTITKILEIIHPS